MVPAYYDVDNDLRSDDDMADLKQVKIPEPPTWQSPLSSVTIRTVRATISLHATCAVTTTALHDARKHSAFNVAAK